MLGSTLEFFGNIPWIPLIIGIGLLLGGGHWLVEGSVSIARRFGVSTLLIGLTVVAFGTSSPELFFNVTAALSGNGGLSFGNVVGSNIANIALVLGLTALIAPIVVHSRVVKKELPLLILVSAGMLGLAWLPPSEEIGGRPVAVFGLVDGAIMLGGFAAFTWAWYRMGRRDRADPLSAGAEAEAEDEVTAAGKRSLGVSIALFIVGLLGLLAGGKLTQDGAVGIAEDLGLSNALIGLTIVAFATSLPELITSLVACRKGHSDLAVGNVVGSNLFNILLVLGLTAVVSPVPVPPDRGWIDLIVMLAFTLVLLPIAMTGQRRISPLEGAFLLACYVGYIAYGVIRELP